MKANTFQSIDGQVAYGDEALSTQVFMTKINLSGDAWAINQLVDSLKITVGGEEKVYGLPANVDEEGCLYLWLPKTGQNKEIRATLSVMHTDGTAKEMEPFFIKEAVHNSLLKRYAGIEIPDSFFKTLEKVYDGLPIETNAVETAGLVSKEIEPRPIDQADKISYTAQRLDEDNNEISEEETRSLPIDAGKWQITVTSNQYSMDTNFSNSYWGHRGYYKSVLITRAESKTTVSYERTSSSEENPSISNKKVKLNAVVSPAGNEALTCASPTGKVQFYVNGKAVGQPVELISNGYLNQDGYYYSEASYEWTPSAEDVVPSSDRYNVTAKYIGDVHGVNYKSSEGTSGEKLDITPIKQETAITIKDVTVADDPKDVTDQEISYKFTDGSCTLKAEGGNSSEDFVYKSSDSSVAEIDSATGKVIFKDFGTVTITVTKPGNAAYQEKSEKVTLTILPSAPTSDDLNVTKTAENTTDPGAPTQVNDVIKYKISAENKLIGSLWKNISIKDYIPVGMDLDENSLYLLHPDGTETKLVGNFYDKTTRLLEVEIGDVRGGEKYSLCFDVRINAEAVGKDIGNTTEASGTTPDGDVVGGGTSIPVYPSEEDTPDNGGVLWGNPTPGIEKTAENKTHDGAATTVSDRITYTIKVENKKQGSVWKSVSIRDRIPEGLLVDTDSMYLTTTEGTEIHVDPTAYREQERMISVYVGDVYGGEKYIFRFDVFVQADAIGKDIGNEAIAIGKNPDGSNGIGGSGGTGGAGTVGGTGSIGGTGGGIWSGGSNGWSGGYTGGPYTIGSPYYPEDDPYTSIEEGSGVTTNGPVYPWDDDEEGAPEGVLPGNAEPELGKTVTNETTKDGSTKENDILTYEIELTNPKMGTLWKNVMIFDYLPEELELDVSSLVLIYPNGVKKKVSASVYNSKTHMINVPIAELWGGETYILRYKVKVVLNEDEEAKKEIVNRAEATGENPDGTVTDAGKGPTSSVAIKYPEVVKKSDTIQNTGKTDSIKTDSAKVNGNKTNSIKTGDSTSVKMLMVLFVSSAMVLIVILAVSLKKRKTNKK